MAENIREKFGIGYLVSDQARIAALQNHVERLEQALRAAMHTIEGYRHGNVSHDVADEVLPIVRAALNGEKDSFKPNPSLAGDPTKWPKVGVK